MRSVSFLFCVALLALGAVGHTHPVRGGKSHPHELGDEPSEISEKLKTKRLESVIRQAERRRRTVEQRSKDRREFIRRRLGRHLNGGELTPELVAELKVHAERTALLREIRYVSAKEKDYDTVVAADKVLARQNSRHELWWRTVLREARKK